MEIKWGDPFYEGVIKQRKGKITTKIINILQKIINKKQLSLIVCVEEFDPEHIRVKELLSTIIAPKIPPGLPEIFLDPSIEDKEQALAESRKEFKTYISSFVMHMRIIDPRKSLPDQLAQLKGGWVNLEVYLSKKEYLHFAISFAKAYERRSKRKVVIYKNYSP